MKNPIIEVTQEAIDRIIEAFTFESQYDRPGDKNIMYYEYRKASYKKDKPVLKKLLREKKIIQIDKDRSKVWYKYIGLILLFINMSSCLLPYIPPGQQNKDLQGKYYMMIDSTRTINIEGDTMKFYVDSFLVHKEFSTRFTADYFNVPCIAFTSDNYQPCVTDGGSYYGEFSHNREGTIDFHTTTTTGNQYLPTRPLDFVFIRR